MSKLDELIKKYCPDGVEYKNLHDICEIRGRIGFRGYTKQDVVAEGEGAISLSPSNILNGEISFNKCTYISWSKYEESPEIKAEINDILFCKTASVGKTALIKKLPKEATINPQLVILKNISCNASYLSYVLKTNFFQEKINKIKGLGTVPTISQKELSLLSIPVPPLPVQEEIVRILDSFTSLTAELQAELQARKKQYEYYFNKIINMYKSPKAKLGEIGNVKMCKRILKSQTKSDGDVPFFKIGTFGKSADAYISKELYDEYIKKYSHPHKGDILISCSGTIGRTIVYDGSPAYFQDSNIVWLEHNSNMVTNEYLGYAYMTNPWLISTGGTISRLYNDGILNAEIPLPTIQQQKNIVKLLDRFNTICNDITTGIPAEIAARQKQYEYYRDKLLTFKELS